MVTDAATSRPADNLLTLFRICKEITRNVTGQDRGSVQPRPYGNEAYREQMTRVLVFTRGGLFQALRHSGVRRHESYHVVTHPGPGVLLPGLG